jgi:hypothetical protein
MTPMITNLLPNIAIKKYNCICCDYMCSNKTNYTKHLLTRKHIDAYERVHNNIKPAKKYKCKVCQNDYSCRQSLYRHNKMKCNKNTDNENIVLNKDPADNEVKTSVNEMKTTENEVKIIANDVKTLTNLVLELVRNNTELQKQNQEFQIQVMEICKTSNTVNNISNNNSHNKTFNLQVFLNEECKDAMNLSEFIESIQLKLPDLLNIGKLGYTEGISKIILKELSETAQNKRPVHCSDIKRETMYIKQENKWEKEGPENIRLKNAIKNIEQKNIALLMNDWKAEHPDHMKSESSENDEYLRLVNQLTSGNEDNLNKVVRRIAKDVIINKK